MGKARANAQRPNQPGRKNLIINGAMEVAQRGTTGSFTQTNTYLVDRFSGGRFGTTTDPFTAEQVSDAPEGFQNSYQLTQDGTTVTLTGTAAYGIQYRPEGQDLAHLNWGTASAQAVTMSFYVKSSITGTFALTVADTASSGQDIAIEYTVDTANTWEKKELTIPGPTAGTYGTGNTTFAFFVWGIAGVAGSTRETANIGSWGTSASAGATVTRTANTTNAVATTSGATFQLTGVQLEVGSVATAFEHRSYGEELALCQRYYENNADNDIYYNFAQGSGTQIQRQSIQFAVQKRAVPNMTFTRHAASSAGTTVGLDASGIAGFRASFAGAAQDIIYYDFQANAEL